MFKDKITNIIKNKIDGIAITYEEEDGFPEINAEVEQFCSTSTGEIILDKDEYPITVSKI